MKSICFFNSIKFWGGGEKLHLESAIEFKKKKYTVLIAANPNSLLWEKSALEDLKTFPIAVGSLSFLNPLKLIKLVRFYKKNKIDTVIFSTSQDLKIGSISAKVAGVKTIVYLRGLAVPIKASLINRLIFRHLLTHVVANSDETKRNILKYLGKYIDKNKVRTIYHGIDVSKLDKVKSNKLKVVQDKANGVILGNAGRLTSQKGQDNLIKIAKKLKDQKVDFTLFIAGKGDLQNELESSIEEYGLQQEVILLGFVEDMEGFMNSIDIFLLTSIWEGFGFVLVEAMLKSKPVVAFKITSNPEIIQNNVTGFLVNHPDLEAFTKQTKLLIESKNLRKKMGEAGKVSVFDRFQLTDRITDFEHYLIGKTIPTKE